MRGGSGGGHTLLSATQASSNVVFAQLMLELGPENVIEMAHTLGVESELPMVPSIVLGSGEVSVLDMASAYTTFRDHGLHSQPVMIERVEDSRGNIIFEADDPPQQVISPDVADTVTTALRGVVSGGTGTAAQLSGWDVAGRRGPPRTTRTPGSSASPARSPPPSGSATSADRARRSRRSPVRAGPWPRRSGTSSCSV